MRKDILRGSPCGGDGGTRRVMQQQHQFEQSPGGAGKRERRRHGCDLIVAAGGRGGLRAASRRGGHLGDHRRRREVRFHVHDRQRVICAACVPSLRIPGHVHRGSLASGQITQLNVAMTRRSQITGGGSGIAQTIAFVGANPQEIRVKGVGQIETSYLTWEVRDSLGLPIDLSHADSVDIHDQQRAGRRGVPFSLRSHH